MGRAGLVITVMIYEEQVLGHVFHKAQSWLFYRLVQCRVTDGAGKPASVAISHRFRLPDATGRVLPRQPSPAFPPCCLRPERVSPLPGSRARALQAGTRCLFGTVHY